MHAYKPFSVSNNRSLFGIFVEIVRQGAKGEQRKKRGWIEQPNSRLLTRNAACDPGKVASQGSLSDLELLTSRVRRKTRSDSAAALFRSASDCPPDQANQLID